FGSSSISRMFKAISRSECAVEQTAIIVPHKAELRSRTQRLYLSQVMLLHLCTRQEATPLCAWQFAIRIGQNARTVLIARARFAGSTSVGRTGSVSGCDLGITIARRGMAPASRKSDGGRSSRAMRHASQRLIFRHPHLPAARGGGNSRTLRRALLAQRPLR